MKMQYMVICLSIYSVIYLLSVKMYPKGSTSGLVVVPNFRHV